MYRILADSLIFQFRTPTETGAHKNRRRMGTETKLYILGAVQDLYVLPTPNNVIYAHL